VFKKTVVETSSLAQYSMCQDPLSYLYSAFQQPFTNIKLKNATTGEIEKIITQLKNKNSCGYDEMSAKI